MIGLLYTKGFKPKRAAYNSPWDVSCGDARVEIKASVFNGKHWLFNIQRHGKLNEGLVDFYILRLENSPTLFGKYAIHLVVPAPLKTQTIVVSPRSLLTRYAIHFNRFDLIRDFKCRPKKNIEDATPPEEPEK